MQVEHGVATIVPLLLWGGVLLATLFFGFRGWGKNKVVSAFHLALAMASITVLFAHIVYPLSESFYVISTSSSLVILLILLSPPSFGQFKRFLGLESVIKEQKLHFNNLINQAYEGIYLVDPETNQYIDANPSGLKALGYSLSEIRKLTIENVHPDTHMSLKRHFDEVVTDRNTVIIQIWAVRKNGERIYVELTLAPFVKEGRTFILATGRDLTRWLNKNEQLSQLNRLYDVLSQCNRAINVFKDEEALFENIIRIVTEDGGFRIAWFGEVVDWGVKPTITAGHDRGYVDSLSLRFDNEETARGPVIQSVLTKQSVCINNVLDNPQFSYWRDRARENDIASIAALPILAKDRVANVLVLYSEQKSAFDSKMINLLNNLAEDLTTAKANIYSEQQRKKIEVQLRRLSSAVDQSADAILIMSQNGLIEYINPRFEKLTGYSHDEVVNRSPGFLCFDEEESSRYEQILSGLPSSGQWKGEIHYKRKDGSEYWSKDVITPIRGEAGNIIHYVATSEDFTALREAQSKINQLAFYDSLTGLANKRLVLDRIKQSISSINSRSHQVAIMFVDLDRFKAINDSLGHRAGDKLIKVVAKRLSSCVKALDTVARMGADEFVVVIGRLANVWDAAHLAQNMLTAIEKNIDIEGVKHSLTASIGISLSPDDGVDENDLIRKADMAMFHAKSEGRNNFQFYREEMNEKAVGQLDLERRLRTAVKEQKFVLHYQPQVSLTTGEIIGLEALIRWPVSDDEMVPPFEFIPVAEEAGFMSQIGAWVIRQAFRDAARIQALAGSIKMAVNLSLSQFKEADNLILDLTNTLKETGVNPTNVQMELTESMLAEDVDVAIDTMNKMRGLGVSVAIDDFGTGYSSLSYLSMFPIDCLKIDKSFVSNMMCNRNDSTLTAAIISLGHNLGMSVLAEGVETEDELQKLQALGCDNYQGYYFSKPLPLESVLALIKQSREANQNI